MATVEKRVGEGREGRRCSQSRRGREPEILEAMTLRRNAPGRLFNNIQNVTS